MSGWKGRRPLRMVAGGLAAFATLAVALFAVAVPDAARRAAQVFLPGNQGYEPAQPFDFDHRLHAGERGIPCLFCHAGTERGAVGVVPSLEMCMGCHASIPAKGRSRLQAMLDRSANGRGVVWTRVHDLPDFVRFDHRRHLERGVDCATCHGPVQEMVAVRQWAPLTMGWCIQCHRDSTATGRHRASTDCQACHR